MTTAAELLLDTAQRRELHHAIILHGPERETLRALAIGLAKTLNCLNASRGGDVCLTCQHIERKIHPDVHFIEVEGDKKLISVDQIRDMVGEAVLRPYEGKSKVFIIDPADAVSVSAYNATLKTLEEPARDTFFILLTRSPDLLLPTIRSRSQSIYVGGQERRDEALESLIRDGLTRFARQKESAALLAIAAAVADREELSDSLALLGTILCEGAAGKFSAIDNVPRERLLAAADGVMAALRGMIVNVDARLVIEQALAELVV